METSTKTQEQRQGQSAEPPRVDLVAKLLAFALDPAAREGEASNAAEKMVRVARREGIGYAAVSAFLASEVESMLPDPGAEPPACEVVMPFGKYAGTMLGDIAREEIEYLRWLHEEAQLRPALRSAVREVYHYFIREAA